LEHDQHISINLRQGHGKKEIAWMGRLVCSKATGGKGPEQQQHRILFVDTEQDPRMVQSLQHLLSRAVNMVSRKYRIF